MVSVANALGQQSQMRAALDAGVDAIDNRQSVTFTLYTSLAVAQDGFLFWVPTAQTVTVRGALHYSSDLLQAEDETVAENHVILTAEQEITEFNLTAPGQMWIASWPVAQGDATLKVAFSSRADYFGPADLWHYRGIAVLPPMSAQIIASAADLPSGPIVSNSLPFWLAQNSLAPVYPSFLVPQNVVPPYISAHIEPSATEALQAFPLYTGWPSPMPSPLPTQLYQLTANQLCRDRVRLTFYGFNAQMAQQFLASLIDYSVNTGNFGFMSNPCIRDEKRTQREIMTLAQKKTIDLTVSYYQTAADAVARRLIVEALVTTTVANP